MNPETIEQDPKIDLSPRGIWHRLPTESPPSYDAFCVYLELGLDATLQQVADSTGKSLPAICALSARHHWMDRAAACRQHISHTLLASAQRERAKQTELSQLREQIHRQQMWEDAQILRSAGRHALQNLVANSQAKIAAYEIKGLFDLQFKLGCRATAPTGFTSDGPAPASPDFEASMKMIYGQKMPLDELLDLMLLAHPGQEAMIREKIARAAAAEAAQDSQDPVPASHTNHQPLVAPKSDEGGSTPVPRQSQTTAGQLSTISAILPAPPSTLNSQPHQTLNPEP